MTITKKPINPISWLIPSSINLNAVLANYPPTFKYKIDHFYFIIDVLTVTPWRDIDQNGGFIELNAQELQSFNQKYRRYLNYLIAQKVIACDNYYIVGLKAKGYKLVLPLNSTHDFKYIQIIDYVLNEKVKRSRLVYDAARKNSLKHYKYLAKWFNSKLSIDQSLAIDKIIEVYPYQTGSVRGPIRGKASNAQKRLNARIAIEKIIKKDFKCTVDDSVGRFHSNLTNLKKELRSTLTYNKKKLIEIDIKNAQPLFSTLLLKKEFYTTNSLSLNFNSILNLASLKPLQFDYTIMLVDSLGKADKAEIESYVEMVNSGEFYKQLSDLLFPEIPFKKKQMKELVYTIFFSSNRFIGQQEARSKALFKRKFPSVYEIFSIIKRKDNNSLLPILLQRIESHLMINTIAKRIGLEKPDLPIFTIHDSLVTYYGYEDYVSNVIKEEVFVKTGLNAKLGITKLF